MFENFSIGEIVYKLRKVMGIIIAGIVLMVGLSFRFALACIGIGRR